MNRFLLNGKQEKNSTVGSSTAEGNVQNHIGVNESGGNFNEAYKVPDFVKDGGTLVIPIIDMKLLKEDCGQDENVSNTEIDIKVEQKSQVLVEQVDRSTLPSRRAHTDSVGSGE